MREAGGFRMGPFELMDLIGHDVNFAVTRSVWEAYFHDPRYAPSVLQQELVAGGLPRAQVRPRLLRLCGRTRAKPAPRPKRAQPRPARIASPATDALSTALRERFAAAGIAVRSASRSGDRRALLRRGRRDPRSLRRPHGHARSRSAIGQPNVVVFDLALDYRTCTRLARRARAIRCSDAAYAAAVGALQAAGIAVSRIDDVAGLVVMRTVAMLANEAADAVTQGIASARDVDLAMRNGVNYPRGPLAWADAIGLGARARRARATWPRTTAMPRYRTSPLLARRCATDARSR